MDNLQELAESSATLIMAECPW